MRCESVQGVWVGDSPIPHSVVATAIVNNPPTLYTGASDGAILWWKILLHPHLEVFPVALLCGHAATLSDMVICTPTKDETVVADVTESNQCLMSSCVDGVLCIWNIHTGHCRRRRKLPPWVGRPSVLKPLPESRRYVCIASSNATSMQKESSHSSDIMNNETSEESKSNTKRVSKGVIAIVDSLNLTILQVIFHGFLSIGTVKSMAIMPDTENGSLIIASDIFANIQSFSVNNKKNASPEVSNNAIEDNKIHVNDMLSISPAMRLKDLAISLNGSLVLFVFEERWMISSVRGGAVIVEESCINNNLCGSNVSNDLVLMGGMFLEMSDYKKNNTDIPDMKNTLLTCVLIWNNQGAAIIYAIYTMLQSNCAIALFELPPVSQASSVFHSFKFSQIDNFLVRVESMNIDSDIPVIQETQVTIWNSPCAPSEHPTLSVPLETKNVKSQFNEYKRANLQVKGGFWSDWMTSHQSGLIGHVERKVNSLKEKAESSKKYDSSTNSGVFQDQTLSNNYCKQKAESSKKYDSSANSGVFQDQTLSNNYCNGNGELLAETSKIITASMILSWTLSLPYAIVFGFHGGEIVYASLGYTVPEFQVLHAKAEQKIEDTELLKLFTGHTGPILCLAAHNLLGSRYGHEDRQLIISGSMDCTVRIWDLDTGCLLSVLHHHVAPVRELVFPPPWTDHPWVECILTVGEDSCVALLSLDTLTVERMFPGHCSSPKVIIWDGVRGYIAALCTKITSHTGRKDVLYVWDVKSGACERVLRDNAAHSFLDHFLKCIHSSVSVSQVFGSSTSASSLLLHFDESFSLSNHKDELVLSSFESSSKASKPAITVHKGENKRHQNSLRSYNTEVLASHEGQNLSVTMSSGDTSSKKPAEWLSSQRVLKSKQAIKCLCPFPGVAALQFDLSAIMAPRVEHPFTTEFTGKKYQQSGMLRSTLDTSNPDKRSTKESSSIIHRDYSGSMPESSKYENIPEQKSWLETYEGHALCLSVSFLHLWGADEHLDKLLSEEMKISKPQHLRRGVGLIGDRNSLTLFLPCWRATYELWKSSSEFCAIRLLTMVSLAQRMITLAGSSSAASSAMTSFYTRGIVEKYPDIRPPSLELYVCFWQDPSEHVRMAARTLFHCAASHSIPSVLRQESFSKTDNLNCENTKERELISTQEVSDASEKFILTEDLAAEQVSEIFSWLDSDEAQDWIFMIGGSDQDAKASRINVSAALAVWYPSLVKDSVASVVAPRLVDLVLTVNGKHSTTAAELLAEGIDGVWKSQIGCELSCLINDVFILIDCLSGSSANTDSKENRGLHLTIRESLIGILLPRLAMAEVSSFLQVVEDHVHTRSSSTIHLVCLKTLVRIIRGAPKAMLPFLDKVVDYTLQTIDTGDSSLRKMYVQSSISVLREMARVFPMVSLNQNSTRIAIGDAVGEIGSLYIRVYDIQSATKIKVLDASGPLHLPNLIQGENTICGRGGISALSFSPNGEGLVAFSLHGLIIRWWSLEMAWWEKFSKNTVPVQCAKLILVPPLVGISPKSSRSSIIANISSNDYAENSQVSDKGISDGGQRTRCPINVDLSYRLEWRSDKLVVLLRYGKELGTFQL